jgi:multidrug efflux pump subunit AcrB
VPGVGDIVLFGQRESRIRVVLDADRLTAFQLTAQDVVTAINQQKFQVAGGTAGQVPGQDGQQFQLTIHALGRLTELEPLQSLLVKATPEGRTVRLQDVASVELDRDERSSASLNGKPAVLLSLHPLPNANPGDVSRAVGDKLAELRRNTPEGLDLAVAFDFTPNLEEQTNPATAEHLVIDAELPQSASAERTAHTLARAAELVRKTPGVQDVLALTEHPFSLDRNRPSLVVRLTPRHQREFNREQIAGNVRSALQNQIPEAVFRPSVPSTAGGFPVYGFPIDFVIEDRRDHGSAALRECAEALVEKLNQSGKFSDAGVGSSLRQVPLLNLDIDRGKCQTLGVEINEVINTMQVYLGSHSVNSFNQFGRAWQMSVQVDPRFRGRNSDILKLQVKNRENQLVPLGTVVAVRDTLGVMVIERHNLYPSARITANLAEGVPLGEAKSLCETLAAQAIGTKQLELIWRIR